MTPSPCIGVCRLDDGGEICLGCGRTLTEIARWPQAADAERERIVAVARARIAVGETDIN